MYKTQVGKCTLGSTIEYNGVNFAIFSRNGTKVKLNIFENAASKIPSFSVELDPKLNRTGDVWHIFVEDLCDNLFYTWQIDGPFDESEGHRFDFTKHLVDPYAKAYSRKLSNSFQKAVIIDDTFLERPIKRPNINLEDSIVYEMHVSLFTKDKSSKVNFPGTYKGVLEKLDYLKSLGVTAIELLPVYEFHDEDAPGFNPKTGEKLKNVWGYNPIGFFALSSKYYSGNSDLEGAYERQLVEFKELVDGIHDAGMEVIIDVVYNHTAEGNEHGLYFNFKGMDNSIFYILERNKKYYSNYSGCGNTLNCNHPVVKEMIIDSLRYWYSVVGVDGFRFDLGSILGMDDHGRWLGPQLSLLNEISNDPILSKAKLFAEGWDAVGGYFIDDFPDNWSIWNGKYRDCIRRFVKGDTGTVGEFVQRVMGSPDIFRYRGKSPLSSLNFITAHDGFTMNDLVSYNHKHNIDNGEDNRDGDNHNNSWNHGEEGESTSATIRELRIRQIKNMMLILLVSQGIPMFLMGDEGGKTQKGNNNAYCQDSPLNYINWDRMNEMKELTHFYKEMIKFRKTHKGLRQKVYRDQLGLTTLHGVKPYFPDLSFDSHSIAFMFEYEKNAPIYAAFNSFYEPLEFELPPLHNKEWYLVVNTNRSGENSFLVEPEKINLRKVIISPRSSILAIAKNIVK